MRYKARNLAALQLVLGGLPDSMQVEVDQDLGVSAKTVGELRQVATWPESLAITTPQIRDAESTVKVGRASGGKRVTPKP